MVTVFTVCRQAVRHSQMAGGTCISKTAFDHIGTWEPVVPMGKGETQVEVPQRVRVPMRDTGAEQRRSSVEVCVMQMAAGKGFGVETVLGQWVSRRDGQELLLLKQSSFSISKQVD